MLQHPPKKRTTFFFATPPSKKTLFFISRHTQLIESKFIQGQICQGLDVYNFLPEAFTFKNLFLQFFQKFQKVESFWDIPLWPVKNQVNYIFLLKMCSTVSSLLWSFSAYFYAFLYKKIILQNFSRIFTFSMSS